MTDTERQGARGLARKLSRRKLLEVSLLTTATAALLAACGQTPLQPPIIPDSLPSPPDNTSKLPAIDWQQLQVRTDTTTLKESFAGANLNDLEIQQLYLTLSELDKIRKLPSGDITRERKIFSFLKTLLDYASILIAQKSFDKFVEISYVFSQLATIITPSGEPMTELELLKNKMSLLMRACLNDVKGENSIAKQVLSTVIENHIGPTIDQLTLNTGAWRMHARNNGLEDLYDHSAVAYQQAAVFFESYRQNPDLFKKIWEAIAQQNGYTQLGDQIPTIRDWFGAMQKYPAAYEQFVSELAQQRGLQQPYYDASVAENRRHLEQFIRLSLEGQVLDLSSLKKKEEIIRAMTAAIFDVFQELINVGAGQIVDALVNEPLTIQKIQQLVTLGTITDPDIKKFFERALNPGNEAIASSIQEKINEMQTDKSMYRRAGLLALAQSIAENIYDRYQEQLKIIDSHELFATVFYKDDSGNETKIQHKIWSITDPMNCNSLAMFPSTMENHQAATPLYVGVDGYADVPDERVTRIVISSKPNALLSGSASFSRDTQLLGVVQATESISTGIQPLLLVKDKDGNTYGINLNLGGDSLALVTQWPECPEEESFSTKLVTLLNSAGVVSAETAANWKRQLITNNGIYAVTETIANNQPIIGDRTVDQVLKKILTDYFGSVLHPENEERIFEFYMALKDQAQPWSGWGLVYPKTVGDVFMFDETVADIHPQLYEVIFTKDGGVLKNQWQKATQTTTTGLTLNSPLQCVSSPQHDKITTQLIHGQGAEAVIDKSLRGDDEFIYILPLATTDKLVKFLAVKKDAVSVQRYSVDQKQSEQDLYYMTAGISIDAALQFGLFKRLFGLTGKVVEVFFKKESPLTPSQAIMAWRLHTIYNSLQPAN